MTVLYEDNHLLVLVKPPNMSVQADASGDIDLLTQAKSYIKKKYQKSGEVYLGLVHRIDRPVGGVIVFARTSKAASRLGEQMQAHKIARKYFCIVRGMPPEYGTLTHWLLKDKKTNTSTVVPQGTDRAKWADLSFQRLASRDDISLMAVYLHTGRSHQIRVQFREIGCPLWGDVRYGDAKPGEQIALFACELSLEHPVLHQPMVFSACPPAKFPWTEFVREELWYNNLDVSNTRKETLHAKLWPG